MTAATLFYFSVVLMLALFGSADFNLRVINLLAICQWKIATVTCEAC